MTFRNLLVATLFVTTALSGQAFAESVKSNNVASSKTVVTDTVRTVRPLAIDGKTNELKPAIQRFVERINMARYALSTKDPVRASAELNEAEKHLNFIRNNSRMEEVSHETVIASGKVTSSTKEKFNSYYVPLEEGPVMVKSVEAKEDGKASTNMNGLAVSSAELVYLNVDLTGKEAPEYIARARNNIKGGNLKAADQDLGEMIDRVATAKVVESVPVEKAYDNVRLALKFLQDDNYSASRYAMLHARDALKEMQRDSNYDQDKTNSLYSKVSQISDLIMQSTPSAAQKARTQIISVRNQLEDMRS